VSVLETQLLLARLRAEGSVPASAVIGTDVVPEAASVGRRLVRLEDRVYLAWADGFEPVADGAPSATVSDFAALVLAVLVGLCWRDPAEDPWPGEPLGVGAVDQLAGILKRDRGVVLRFLGLAENTAEGGLRLGAQIAAWPPRTVAALRRQHHVLAAVAHGVGGGAR